MSAAESAAARPDTALRGAPATDPFLPELVAEARHERDEAATAPADIAAQSVGYASYHVYQSEALHPLKFLDVSLKQGLSDGRAHSQRAEHIAVH